MKLRWTKTARSRWEARTGDGWTLTIQRIRNYPYAYSCHLGHNGQHVLSFENSKGIDLANAKSELIDAMERRRSN